MTDGAETAMRFDWIFGAIGFAALAAAPAQAADYIAHKGYAGDAGIYRGYTGVLPSCADPAVHSYIARRFAGTEREYWNSSLELTEFTRPRELGYRTWGYSFIPRRFCTAKTYTTDGRKRDVVFNIAEGLGGGSIGWGVEWCVTGLDRSYAYAPRCKMARP